VWQKMPLKKKTLVADFFLLFLKKKGVFGDFWPKKGKKGENQKSAANVFWGPFFATL